MPFGERALSKSQFGVEGTSGTAVAADTFLLGAEVVPVPADRVPTRPEDALGVRIRSRRKFFYQYLANGRISIPHAYFNVLPAFFSAGVKGGVTAVEQTGSQADYLWTHSPSLTATNALQSWTLEVGDNVQAYEIEYVLMESIKLSAVIGQGLEESPVALEANYFGRQVTASSFSAVSIPSSVETMNGKLSRIFIDSTWSGRGSTEKTQLLRSWELEILTGVHPKMFGDANRYFAAHGEGFIMPMLTLTYEGSDVADTEFDAFQAGTEKVIQIQVNGSQIGTGVNYQLKASIYGIYETVVPLDSEDSGNNLHRAVFVPLYDPTGAQTFELTVITNSNAI